MTRALFASFRQVGQVFAETGTFDPVLLRRLAQPEYYPAILAPVYKIFSACPSPTNTGIGSSNRTAPTRNALPGV